jgi:hypothetical protein
MVQKLVSSGHSWLDVKHYTLSEVGTFLAVILRQEITRRADKLTTSWMGTHLSPEGYEQAIKEMMGPVRVNKVNKGPSPKAVASEWQRLATTMKGVR